MELFVAYDPTQPWHHLEVFKRPWFLTCNSKNIKISQKFRKKLQFSWRVHEIFLVLDMSIVRTFYAVSFRQSGYVGASPVLESSWFFMILTSWFSSFLIFLTKWLIFRYGPNGTFRCLSTNNTIGAFLKRFWDLDFWLESPYSRTLNIYFFRSHNLCWLENSFLKRSIRIFLADYEITFCSG